MPTKTAHRRERFANSNRGKGKSKGNRQTRFTNKSAPATKGIGTGGQPTPKGAGKRSRRWASDQQVRVADKMNGGRGRWGSEQPNNRGGKTSDNLPGNGMSAYERVRRGMIHDRNRRRRYPWIPAVSAIAVGLLAHWTGMVFAWGTGVPAETVALALATIPLAVAAVVALRHHRTHLRWMPELAVAGAGTAAVVYWIGVAGLSWLTVLVVLLSTLLGGSRWWKANPIGPGVPRLEPPRSDPEAEPTTAAAQAEAAPTPETDPYCIAWADNNARGEGKAKGSRLTNRVRDEFTITYDVELKRGAQTITDLYANRGPLASGLGEDTERVLFKRPPRGAGAHMAKLTIIDTDPVAETRFFTAPCVEDGVIKGPARFIDGSGEIDITMWDDGGTVGTMIVGSTGGGKSGAANVITCNALSTGVLNLLYADPKGNSSTALATRARVAIIGKQNVLKLPWLVTAMLGGRAKLAAMLGADQIFPSKEIPGWMFLHDEYSLIANDPLAQRVWTETVNIVRAYGIWAVALNQSQGMPQWGNDHARSAFASQVIAFRVNSKSGSDLVPGLNFDPNELPVDDKGRPVPGMAVHAHYDTPTRWDFLPSEANAARMAEKGEPAPPYTTTTAFDAFFNQPGVDLMDELAINAVLGPAVNGRWQVGGRGATHEFPASLDDLVNQGESGAPAAKPKGKWGQRGGKTSSDGQLSPVQAEVLELVRGGTSTSGEIVDAAKAGRSSVYDALDVLTSRGLLRRVEQGVYAPVVTEA